MKLDKIRIFGFKSFADETELELSSGFLAIVGPNGCGKSNICDAIRWVLGEQSARILRGKEMGDVIFNGTATRKPLGMAEVTLELTNLGSLPLEFRNIQITRRLYRSGESEYLLNKRLCRLKDITDLFLEWGISRRVYSIIEQGNIDFILTAKPQDRRILIETAAGILKYKERKKETEQKMEQTQANLIRLKDIITEVENQRSTLHKQARQARAYQGICRKSEEMEKRYLILRYKLLGFHLAQAKSLYEDICDNEGALLNALTSSEVEREKSKLEAMTLETDFENLQKGLWQLEGEKRQMEKRLESLSQEKKFREENLMRLAKETGLIRDKKAQAEVSIIAIIEQLNQLQAELSRRQEKYKLLKEERGAYQSIENKISNDIERKRKNLIEINKQVNLVQKKLSHLKAKEDALRLRISENTDEERDIIKGEIRINDTLNQMIKEKEDLLSQITLSHKIKERAEKEQAGLAGTLEDIQERIDKQRDICAGIRHRLTHLEELEKGFEGFNIPVRHLLKDYSGGRRKILAQVLHTENRYEPAIEAILGDHLQDIIIRSRQDAIGMIKELKSSGHGKATFIIEHMNPPDGLKDINPALKAHPGYIGKVIDLVNYPEEFHNLFSFLLGGTFMVTDIEAAMEIERMVMEIDGKRGANNGTWDIVTLEGDIIKHEGIITGGGIKSQKSQSLLSRKRELGEMKEALIRENGKLELLVKEKEIFSKELKCFNEELEKIKTQISQLDGKKRDLDRDTKHLENEKERLLNRKGRISCNQKKWESDLKNIEQEIITESKKDDDLLRDWKQMEKEIEELQGKWNEAQEKGKAIDQAYMEEGIALASLKERIYALEREKGGAGDSILEAEKNLAKITNETGEIKMRIAGAEKDIRSLEDKLPESRERIMKQQEQLEGLRISLNAIKERLIEQEEQIKPVKHELECLRKQAKTQEIEVAQWRTRLEELERTFSIAYPDDTVASEDVPSCEKELEHLQEGLNKLKVRIQNFGPVNLGAIDEYQRIDERFQFLSRQILDLQNALDALKKIIKEINTTSRELFHGTFAKVNKSFNELFTRLFEGGFAELRVEEGIDCLEAGVDIIAQPPGKKLQNIELLSGGEKALTAIAFIFAIYQQKPSPFCILDEVDAPLDETNVDRFLRLIKEMKEKTQFISITHCKRTMMEADALYGVTMEKPGISKIISVKLDRPADIYIAPAPQKKEYQELVQ